MTAAARFAPTVAGALLAALATALPTGQVGAAAPSPRDLLGEWWTPGFGARVRLEPCGDDLVCGRIVWLWDEAAKGAADKGPLVGRTVVERMRMTRPGRWSEGRLHNPEDGRDYTGSLTLRSPSTLVVDGCVLFVCQTQVWRRVDAGRCPAVGG